MDDYKLSAVTAPRYEPQMPPMLTPELIAEMKGITPQLPAEDIRDYYDAWAKRKYLEEMMAKGTGDYSGANVSPWMYLKEAGPISDKEWKSLKRGK